MGRAPTPPKLHLGKLRLIRQALTDGATALMSRFFWYLKGNREALADGEINREFAAFEVLACAAILAEAGSPPRDLLDILPREPDRDKFVVLPLDIVAPLADGWSRYKSAPSGKTLGECFGLEGAKGQGSRPMRLSHRRRLRQQELANEVLTEYLSASAAGQPRSLESVAAQVAETQRVSDTTVMAAYKKFRPVLLERLKSVGLL